MKSECPQRAENKRVCTHARTHTHSALKSFENPEGPISKSAKEKKNDNSLESQSRGVLWLWLFIWSGGVQSALEWTQISISLRYENTCRPQIIPALTTSFCTSFSPALCSSTLLSLRCCTQQIVLKVHQSGKKKLKYDFSSLWFRCWEVVEVKLFIGLDKKKVNQSVN